MDPKTQTPLNPQQKAAAEAGSGPLLIVAGAGTGKTRTLTSRIAYLIKEGMPPARICAITFTNKAAKEMERRVFGAQKGASSRGGLPFIGTFHALGARILRKECRRVERTPNFTIFDDHDSFDIIKKVFKKLFLNAKKEKKKETPAHFAKQISEIKNVDDAAGKADADTLRFFDEYESALQKNNAFDFDDLIQKVVAIFRAHPEVLERYRKLFDVVLVDEYQDINPKQHELVQLLAGAHRNISVVGDDEQTIYSWRYADVKTFLDFDKVWAGAKVHFLEENYRSTGIIIRAAAAVAKNNRFRTPKSLWTKNADGSLINLYEAWGENEEAMWVAGQIEALLSQGAPPSIGILYRTNAQSRAIEQALIRRSIPYRVFGGLKFYERREVKDAVAALRYISNRKDAVAKERLEKNLTKRRLADFERRIGAQKSLSPIEAMKSFLESFDYLEYLRGHFINSEEREDNIAELVTFASEFGSLDELLERLTLLQASDEMKEGDEKNIFVSLMTIHLAKGLEFDTVFIAGASEGLLPHGRSLGDEWALEEERRLMYVAMTRARKNLSISFYGIPSRFISEMPEDCVTLAESEATISLD